MLYGAGWHGANNLAVTDNITLLHLPPYAPELNPVENVRAYLRANKLAFTVAKQTLDRWEHGDSGHDHSHTSHRLQIATEHERI